MGLNQFSDITVQALQVGDFGRCIGFADLDGGEFAIRRSLAPAHLCDVARQLLGGLDRFAQLGAGVSDQAVKAAKG